MPLLEHPWKISDRTSSDLIVRFKGDTVKFPCKRKLLCQASPRFKETLAAKNGQIIITKMSPDMVSLMLRFINKGLLDPTDWQTLVSLLEGAITYEVTTLIAACSKKLELRLSLSNACTLLELASMNALPSLYASSLKVCVEGAFHVMDTDAFNDLLPSTVMAVVSEEALQVPDEAFVLHCLWVRATVEVCRSGVQRLTTREIAKFFDPFSVYVEFEDVDEASLASYGNERLMQYFREVKGIRGFRVYPNKRKMTFPLNVPIGSYAHYDAGRAERLESSRDVCIEFSVSTSVYLIGLRLVGDVKAVDEITLRSSGGVILAFDSARGISNVERAMRLPSGETMVLMEFQISVNSLVKLHRTGMYRLQFKSSDNSSKWPVMTRTSNPYVVIHNSSCVGFTKMIVLPCAPLGE